MVDALTLMFEQGRSHSVWLDRPIEPETLQRVYDLVKLAPTSVNCLPARFVFVSSSEAKERLLPAMLPANVEKVRSAPVTVIVATDTRYYEHLPTLFNHRPEVAKAHADNQALAQDTALRNATLQGGYFILAARGLGLDCGPMSGFDAARIDAAFFPEGRLKTNFLINLGYGDPTALFPRLPRLRFDQACQII